ncbi:hypothetical protein GLOIN_2v1576529 [Rhizophagus irregularis DAOM 181602=DAOM 197198]|uniref:Uncharacterized protein n=1 Tax=Rhizophagus irregularis (strain DAOM 181602 / DAOM 197198 / MUCL 43194) TaxID=747089 RepID=A0A2P4Q9Q5_RHIID|nr:hypothetical protein GLOIN_2v1576529 [Rhizophagus irregularis DAOM 181602=DAOM 197198]POG74370.1 hypothetical protein GLOIN_2v1576529 [Rhizophagus irregularis DAOM 181602=DAOM 197198]|eukprot:XP_025181236.1 hypothetical protein GLOIN_2v1576529 [Rhizophagus irregularis DAOM 181602=DAOM 197198]
MEINESLLFYYFYIPRFFFFCGYNFLFYTTIYPTGLYFTLFAYGLYCNLIRLISTTIDI